MTRRIPPAPPGRPAGAAWLEQQAALAAAMADPAAEWARASPGHRAGLLKFLVDPRAQMLFDALRPSTDWAPQPPAPVPGLEAAMLLMLVKDEADIIGQHLAHHYTLGFRRFFILDNGSTDATASIIAAFRTAHPAAELFYGYDFVPGHYQADKMRGLEAFAQSYLRYEKVQPDWVFYLDADEFIVPVRSHGATERLTAVLTGPRNLLLAFHWVQCSSADVLDAVPPGSDVFTAFPEAWRRMAVPVSKIAYRPGHGFRPTQGNHGVQAFAHDHTAAVTMAEMDTYIFHFATRSVDQVTRKLRRNANCLAATRTSATANNDALHWREEWRWFELLGDAAVRAMLRQHVQACTAPA